MVWGGEGVGEGEGKALVRYSLCPSMLYYNPQVDPKLGCLIAKDTACVCPP